MGHRRWLEADHIYHQDAQSFDGTCETRPAPMRLTGSEALRQLECIEDEYNNGSMQPWKRKSIFFQLPYWEHLLLRHNIDVMHTVKNIFDNTCGTITGQQGKSKDNYKAQCDLEDMGIQSDLHPKVLCERDLDLLEYRIAITLYEMEKIFPPFFTIMVHLATHLANEAKLGLLDVNLD
ncbi:hypothetical protein SLEP1_g42730 [Rubroshorea leprosula]|uniref:DUF4218 domain-containing protein n=1 Tax=Rubroshorea leprosula TaxID=152421 RepID=A0AAV5LAS4_9ROSI|nr:hypothetical protein SLEP1_g42730 [Rubroshorea leprosula]